MGVTLRFHGGLHELLPPERRVGERAHSLDQHTSFEFSHPLLRRTSFKDLIESLGVPHVEVGRILAGGRPVRSSDLVPEGEIIDVFPGFPGHAPPVAITAPATPTGTSTLNGAAAETSDPAEPFRGALDVHLGRLARWLRLLGLDILYRNDWDDADLARTATAEDRWLLTRDRRLLMRRSITRGCLIRTDDPIEQVREVLHRFRLGPESLRPWSRCLKCNGLLEEVPKESVLDRLEPKTRIYYDRFMECRACRSLYWEGSHFRALRETLGKLGVG